MQGLSRREIGIKLQQQDTMKPGNETGKAEILLANYKTDNDLPVKEWIWFDLTPLQNAVKVKFIPDSSDKNEYGIKTAAYFCLDGITLIEK